MLIVLPNLLQTSVRKEKIKCFCSAHWCWCYLQTLQQLRPKSTFASTTGGSTSRVRGYTRTGKRARRACATKLSPRKEASRAPPAGATAADGSPSTRANWPAVARLFTSTRAAVRLTGYAVSLKSFQNIFQSRISNMQWVVRFGQKYN